MTHHTFPPGEEPQYGPFLTGVQGEPRPPRAPRMVADNVVRFARRNTARTMPPPLDAQPPLVLPSAGAQLVKSIRSGAGRGKAVIYDRPLAPPRTNTVYPQSRPTMAPVRPSYWMSTFAILLFVAALGVTYLAMMRHMTPQAYIKLVAYTQALR